jgi:hypothetical protein
MVEVSGKAGAVHSINAWYIVERAMQMLLSAMGKKIL